MERLLRGLFGTGQMGRVGPAVPLCEGRGRHLSLREAVPGEEEENEGGTCYAVRRLIPGKWRHGGRLVRDLARLDMGLASVLAGDAVLNEMRVHDALFLDTETTGLAGGTGTVAFLVGLAWFEGEDLVVRQLFARDFDEEGAVLSSLGAVLRERGFIVTFNGRAFDCNLLQTRFIMNRLPNPLEGVPHLDLLHPARRLFSHRLASCSLGALEEAVLGVRRSGDVPGWEIPSLYFRWLRHGDASALSAIFDHNRLDLLSMAALARVLGEVLDPEGEGENTPPGVMVRAGRLLLSRRRIDEGRRHLERAAACRDDEAAREARRELSLLYKRAGRWDEALRVWAEMVGEDPGDLFALVELAKWWEHRGGEPARALELTLEALKVASGPSLDDLNRRRGRLEKKIRRRGGEG
ncbi:MAG TPA: ribonuclease H-like domain-containing protein [Syntrophales bacterium]|nr:ribonuclease H-like domain-containing protein [Syntrophales bacterium]HOO00184.1 ribonuclease H-like domain-containing protein [Syntrophales bacterium]HPQ06843.1 ribonuclease H-like domain-containing protein [Syntrophales bacterium]HRS87074.1 ribonuclease H-like domain-containing protein [Syntrophales bacterium]HRV42723.1 ribonuclease H-like domain-containing protein [Syntrophales bacterium]